MGLWSTSHLDSGPLPFSSFSASPCSFPSEGTWASEHVMPNTFLVFWGQADEQFLDLRPPKAKTKLFLKPPKCGVNTRRRWLLRQTRGLQHSISTTQWRTLTLLNLASFLPQNSLPCCSDTRTSGRSPSEGDQVWTESLSPATMMHFLHLASAFVLHVSSKPCGGRRPGVSPTTSEMPTLGFCLFLTRRLGWGGASGVL